MKKIIVLMITCFFMAPLFAENTADCLKTIYSLSGNQVSVFSIVNKHIKAINNCFDKIHEYIHLSFDLKQLIEGDTKNNNLLKSFDALAEGAAFFSLPIKEVNVICSAILKELDFTQNMTIDERLQAFKRAMIMKNMLIASFVQGATPTNEMLNDIRQEKEYLLRFFAHQDDLNEKIKKYDDALDVYTEKSKNLVDELQDAKYNCDHTKKKRLLDIKDGNIQLSWFRKQRFFWGLASIDDLKKEQAIEYGQEIQNAEQEFENKKKSLIKKQQFLDHDLMAIWTDIVSDIYKKELKIGFLSEKKYTQTSEAFVLLWYVPRKSSNLWLNLKEKYLNLKKLHNPLSHAFREISVSVNNVRLSKVSKTFENASSLFNRELESMVTDLLNEFKGLKDVHWNDFLSNTNKVYFLTTFIEFLVKSKVFKQILPVMLRGLDEQVQEHVGSLVDLTRETLLTLAKGGFNAASLLSLAGLAGENNIAFALRLLKHMLLMARYEEKDEVYSHVKKVDETMKKLVLVFHQTAKAFENIEIKLNDLSERYLKYSLTEEDKLRVLDNLGSENRSHLKNDVDKNFNTEIYEYPLKFMKDSQKLVNRYEAKGEFAQYKGTINVAKPIPWKSMDIAITNTKAKWNYKPSWLTWLWNGINWCAGIYAPDYWDLIRDCFKRIKLIDNISYRESIDKSKLKEIDEINNETIKDFLNDIRSISLEDKQRAQLVLECKYGGLKAYDRKGTNLLLAHLFDTLKKDKENSNNPSYKKKNELEKLKSDIKDRRKSITTVLEKHYGENKTWPSIQIPDVKNTIEIPQAFDSVVAYLIDPVDNMSKKEEVLNLLKCFEEKKILKDLLCFECPYKKKTIYNYVKPYLNTKFDDQVICTLVVLYNKLIQEEQFKVPEEKIEERTIEPEQLGSTMISLLGYYWNKTSNYINTFVERNGKSELIKHEQKLVLKRFKELEDFITTKDISKEDSENMKKTIKEMKDWKVFDKVLKHKNDQDKTLENIINDNFYSFYGNKNKKNAFNDIELWYKTQNN